MKTSLVYHCVLSLVVTSCLLRHLLLIRSYPSPTSCRFDTLLCPFKFFGDIFFYYIPLVHGVNALLCQLHFFVLFEMLNVFGVRQVFKTRVLVVVFLPVVNLILVLVIAVVARPGAKVGQSAVLVVNKDLELVAVDHLVFVVVNQAQDFANNFLLALLRHVLVGLVKKTVRPHDLLGLPLAVAVVIVQLEEGGRVEVGCMVFLCSLRRHC